MEEESWMLRSAARIYGWEPHTYIRHALQTWQMWLELYLLCSKCYWIVDVYQSCLIFLNDSWVMVSVLRYADNIGQSDLALPGSKSRSPCGYLSFDVLKRRHHYEVTRPMFANAKQERLP